MLTGRISTAVKGLVFYDAWELAESGTPGYTWSNLNPPAAIGLCPDRRFDDICSARATTRRSRQPVRCSLLAYAPPTNCRSPTGHADSHGCPSGRRATAAPVAGAAAGNTSG